MLGNTVAGNLREKHRNRSLIPLETQTSAFIWSRVGWGVKNNSEEAKGGSQIDNFKQALVKG